ncbi:glycoside hydrolase family 19 protein [Arcobacter vandammei]|uniref:glycoside hydrolase family 19 protein n=1 Tax=Arcobacter vandammei TaxID=2782243 RepID=UPI0018DF0062|nr:hypothetical protein [Arcobacter vandammei]
MIKAYKENILIIADNIIPNDKEQEFNKATVCLKLLDINKTQITDKIYKEEIDIKRSSTYKKIFDEYNVTDYDEIEKDILVFKFTTEELAENKLKLQDEDIKKIAYVSAKIEAKCTKTAKNDCDKWLDYRICNFKITEEDFNQIFPKAPAEKRKEVLEIFNKYCCAFEINTPLRASHFFAQVRAEVGDTLVGSEESLWYSVEALKITFSRYFKHFPNEANRLGYIRADEAKYKNLSIENKKLFNIKNGRYYYKQLPKEDEIAKRVYCCDDNGFTLKEGGCENGLLYKGKGFIQLTWKDNYQNVNKILKEKVPKENLNIVDNPNGLLETKVGMLSAMGFWEWKKLNNIADKGAIDSVVDLIVNVVNEKTGSRNARKQYFQDIYKILKDK